LLVFEPAELAADESVYTKVDVHPMPIKTPPPEYPWVMERQYISGVVAVELDEEGAVARRKVVKSSHLESEAPALAAVKKWKFKPAQKDGNSVKMRVTLPIVSISNYFNVFCLSSPSPS